MPPISKEMIEGDVPAGGPARQSSAFFDAQRLTEAFRAAGPPLLFGLRLWASVCLALYIAFWLELDNAYSAGTSAAIMCQPHLGASLRKGGFRMIGTIVGGHLHRGADRVLSAGSRALPGRPRAVGRRLATLFAALSAEITNGFTSTLRVADLETEFRSSVYPENSFWLIIRKG